MKIEEITKQINSFFQSINNRIVKVIPIPAILLLCSIKSKPGLSALKSLSNVCVGMEKLGIPTTNNPDGSPNLYVGLTYEILKEVYRAQTEDAVIQGAVEPGAIQVMTAQGPGSNILPVKVEGSIF